MMRFVVSGPLACFARPESPDRFTYPVPPPSALRAVASAIYDHPGVWHDIRRIHVLKPIRYMRIGLVQRAVHSSYSQRTGHLTRTSDERRPTVQTVLRDCAWMVDFEWRFVKNDTRRWAHHERNEPEKWTRIFASRIEKGQFYLTPSLGRHGDYRALVRPATADDVPIAQSRDFGVMLHDFDYTGPRPVSLSYHAQMHDGVIEVPSFYDRVYGSERRAA